MIEDQKAELQFVSAICDLSAYDIKEAKSLIERSGITQADFSNFESWKLLEASYSLIKKGLPANQENLLRELDGKIQNGRLLAVINSILKDCEGWAAEGYLEIVLKTADRRSAARLIDEARSAIDRADADPIVIKDKLINGLHSTRGSLKSVGLDKYVEKVYNHLRSVTDGKVKPVIPTYIRSLDSVIGGLQPTLTLVGAEPGVGKSALFAALVHNQAKSGHRPFIASLEDEPTWLAYRLMSADSGVDQTSMRFTRISQFDLLKLQESDLKEKEHRSRIRVVDGSEFGMRIEDLLASMTEAVSNEDQKCDSFWIDHLGEIPLGNTERPDLAISRYLSLLRGFANRHSVPVVVAAHFKRPHEGGSGAESPPSFRDFANSSGAERKARVALGLKREPGSDKLRVYVLKQTNGPSGGMITLGFQGTAAMVVDCE